MTGKRDATRSKITWTLDMNNKLLRCKTEAREIVKSENPPLKANGRKKGYMEVMRELFLEYFPGLDSLTAQNLRDKVASLEKNIESSVCSLQEIVTIETHNVNTLEAVDSGNTGNMLGMCDQNPLTELESKTLTNARDLLNKLIVEVGDMSNRKWATRTRKTPSIQDIKSIDNVCRTLIMELKLADSQDALYTLWVLNCIIYAVIVSWLLNTNVKCEIPTATRKDENKKYVPKWERDFNDKLKSLRSFISKCNAEIVRLSKNGRLTRKTRRNREALKGEIKNEELSIYSITKCMERSKAKLKRLARKRKRKISSEKAKLWNTKFKEKQSNVYNTFKDMINRDTEKEYPVFREISKSRKFHQSKNEVEIFWKNLWLKTDEGKPEILWLEEIEEVFKSIVGEVNEGDVILNEKDFLKIIKKKRNWSSPGPDLVVNFWLKKLTSTYEISNKIFNEIVNKDLVIPTWFSCGKTGLLEKPGTWEVSNNRPITCTNNQYKLFTSFLNSELDKHNQEYNLMQMDQRGAKEKCSGTHQNLLIDDMVLKDAQQNKRNLATAWIDIRKAYDSLSHTWLIKCLNIHRFPVKLVNTIISVINSWSVRLVVPLEKEDALTDLIPIRNGLLQGDSICANLFTLALNPVAWEIRRTNGYVLSKPISTKITHLIYIDDLKVYTKGMNELSSLLSNVKSKMEHAGLHWNAKKCNFLSIIRGKRDNSVETIPLDDDSTIKAVENEKTYKFLGVPEAEQHEIKDVMAHLTSQVKQRASIVWSSPLSDYNKVLATNIFVLSPALYFMWTEKMKLVDLRNLDIMVREAMNRNSAKYKLQMNASLYLERSRGGRGLKSFEMAYKEIKVKAAIRLVTETDDRMTTVKKFDLNRKEKNRSSIIKDGIDYALNDFDIHLTITENNFEIMYKQNDADTITTDKIAISKALRKATTAKWEGEMLKSNWQGNIFKFRIEDEHLIKSSCYNWLTSWKDCAVNIINDIHSIHLQTVPTLSFTAYRSDSTNTSKICRLCHKGEENVKHLLSSCGKLVKVDFIRRHNKALQCILFPFLESNEFIDNCPPWYTHIIIKPRYENEDVLVLWDIPEYSGTEEEEDDNKLYRPDGKIIFKKDKKVVLLEMSVPWIGNREIKLEEKVVKYEGIIRNLKLEYPDFRVDQATFIIDALGGYSQHLKSNIAKIGYSSDTIEMILRKMQKIVLSEARYIVNKFKISTST